MTASITASSVQNSSFGTNSSTLSALTTSGRITSGKLYNLEYLENKYAYKETETSYETKYASDDAVVENEISNILYLMENGYEDKALEAYNELLVSMSEQSQYSTLTDKELQSVAKELLSAQVEEETDGEYTDIEDYIVDKTADANENYTQKCRYINSKVDDTTEEDLPKAICGIDADDTVSAGTKVKNAILGGFNAISTVVDALFGAKHH